MTTAHEPQSGPRQPEPEAVASSDRPNTFDRMRQANRLSIVGQLASGVTHDLGTPLNVVAGRAKLITAQLGDEARVRRNAEIIGVQVERMTSLLRSQLVFSRAKHAPDARSALSTSIDEALRLVTPFAGKRNVQVEKTGDDAAIADIDRDSLLQVLVNLFINACQAMPNGGQLRVSVQQATASGEPSENGTATHLLLRVADTGAGIAPEDLPHVFEPFFSTKIATEGTGLGLCVCEQILRNCRGTIRLESSLGKGTVVSLCLPRLPS